MQSIPYRRWLKILAGTVFMVLALGSAHAGGRFVFISHGADSDSWWNTVKNALKHAAEDFNATVDYRNPSTGDIADMARLVEQAAAQNYDGVIVTIADYDVLRGAIKKVTDKKIPLITVNSGLPSQSEQLGAIMHVGQDEYEAGHLAGEKAKERGVTSFVCVNHLATNPASFERCRGFGDAIGADFRKSTIDTGLDPAQIESMTSAYLRQNPSTGAVFAIGPDSAHGALQALARSGRQGKLVFSTVDVSDIVVRGIKSGAVSYVVDQQPYLQSYIPVGILALMKDSGSSDRDAAVAAFKAHEKARQRFDEYGLVPVYGPRNIGSGPGVVDASNVDKVARYAGQYR